MSVQTLHIQLLEEKRTQKSEVLKKGKLNYLEFTSILSLMHSFFTSGILGWDFDFLSYAQILSWK